jgi:hypothetical protein
MKKISLIFLITPLLFLNSCKDKAVDKINKENVQMATERDSQIIFPSISFDKTLHDFGDITNGTPVETIFSYTNSGRSPLVVTDIKSTCGCTVPQGWSKSPLMPGESSQFSVKFNGKGANKVSKTITLTTNTENGREQVRITAFVKPDPNAPSPSAIKNQ